MVKKVLYNDTYGGFRFSAQFVKEYENRFGPCSRFCFADLRDDANAIALFEELGSEASSHKHSKLKCFEYPDHFKYKIDEYDGKETVYTKPDIPDVVIDDLLWLARKASVDNSERTMHNVTKDMLASNCNTYREFVEELEKQDYFE